MAKRRRYLKAADLKAMGVRTFKINDRDLAQAMRDNQSDPPRVADLPEFRGNLGGIWSKGGRFRFFIEE